VCEGGRGRESDRFLCRERRRGRRREEEEEGQRRKAKERWLDLFFTTLASS
jgi:hypothetical protein